MTYSVKKVLLYWSLASADVKLVIVSMALGVVY